MNGDFGLRIYPDHFLAWILYRLKIYLAVGLLAAQAFIGIAGLGRGGAWIICLVIIEVCLLHLWNSQQKRPVAGWIESHADSGDRKAPHKVQTRYHAKGAAYDPVSSWTSRSGAWKLAVTCCLLLVIGPTTWFARSPFHPTVKSNQPVAPSAQRDTVGREGGNSSNPAELPGHQETPTLPAKPQTPEQTSFPGPPVAVVPPPFPAQVPADPPQLSNNVPPGAREGHTVPSDLPFNPKPIRPVTRGAGPQSTSKELGSNRQATNKGTAPQTPVANVTNPLRKGPDGIPVHPPEASYSQTPPAVDDASRSMVSATASIGKIGLVYRTITPQEVHEYGLDAANCVLVTGVTVGSDAYTAGIRTNDVILTVNGSEAHDLSELRQMIAESGARRSISLGLWRNGQRRSAQVNVDGHP